MKISVLSPDGFQIERNKASYRSRKSAETALDNWIRRYDFQGYYSTSSRERIPLANIKERCQIIENS